MQPVEFTKSFDLNVSVDELATAPSTHVKEVLVI